MDIRILETALKEIEKNVKVLENSKFEKIKTLVKNGRQVKLTLSNDDLTNLFDVEKIESVEKFTNTDRFSKNKNVKLFEFKGGFVILK